MLAWLLAHQGGWDEILMVLGPLGLLWFLLRKAKARAEEMDAPDPDEMVNPTETPTPPTS
jgi:hypothetical protein